MRFFLTKREKCDINHIIHIYQYISMTNLIEKNLKALPHLEKLMQKYSVENNRQYDYFLIRSITDYNHHLYLHHLKLSFVIHICYHKFFINFLHHLGLFAIEVFLLLVHS